MKHIKVWIVIIILEILAIFGLLILISTMRSHSKALPFEIDQSLRMSYDLDLADKTEENYWQFVNQRFILINDDEGILQWVKIDNEFGRNDYEFENALTEDEYFRYYSEDGVVTSSVGIDVSKYQGNIDWSQVKAAGVDFAFIRLGFRGYGNGKIVLDSTYAQNMDGAINNGIHTGVYFYSQAVSYEEGVEEARFVLQNVRGYAFDLPIVLDTEDAEDDSARTAGLTVEQRTDACLGFLETIRDAGYPVMFYANLRWIALSLDITRLHGYDIWFAQYADVPKLPYRYQIWQYSKDGYVPGISKPVDLNIGFDHYGIP
ncbi:MAG: glycoside hydrolase family 25 protein [Lachnospiraceae bacterium]|nr:glycoside hydrolase family 25 protein [Lachnospiraceae bacterium]